jgi:hypothetical protein
MWNEEQQQRFQQLRNGERSQTLNSAEKRELKAMIRELEQEEMAMLRPAIQRMEQESVAAKEHSRELKTVLRRLQKSIQRSNTT